VLGISGGVDSLMAGRLCQLAVEQLRSEDYAAGFIALRLPYKTQADESDAQASLAFITPDHIDTLNIAASVDGLMACLTATEASAAQVDFIKGNVKARTRMIAQYAMANLHNGLVGRHRPRRRSIDGVFHQVRGRRVRPGPLSA